MNININRRRLLAASGLLAGSLFLPSRRARAQSAAPPKRLVVFFTQHGTVYPNWRMRPAGVSESADFEFDLASAAESELSPILQPMWGMRQKLCVVDGVSMASAEANPIGNNHDIGTRHALTGQLLQGGGAGGASIDQIVAGQIRVAGRIDSLELAVVGTANGGAVWRGAGQSLPADADPSSVYNRVFPSSFESPTPTADQRIHNAQQSVLDVVKEQYAALAPRLSTADRQKLELHHDLVRDAEARLQTLQSMQCARPSSPSLSGSYGGAAYYDTRCDAMWRMITAALACDLTRVVTVQMGQLWPEQIGAPPGDVHADYAHHQNDNATARQMMTNYGRVHATEFAELLALLDSVPEGNGTLLDSCAVVWVSELANGVHDLRPWPVVIGGGAIAGGRYLYYAPNIANPSTGTSFPGYNAVIGPPHNKLWVSVANAVGAPITSLGATSLTTPTGAHVDCTGPLPRLS